MENRRAWRRARVVGLALGATLLFVVLATLNTGGYRYGVSDQAFYIPAIRHHLDPQLFPRDWPMLGAQDRLNLFTAALALKARLTGFSLPTLFFLAYGLGLAILFWAIVAIGRTLYRSWWTVAALAFAMTLRHRVVQTGVNTLEGYMHPRMIAFAAGAAAVAVFLRGASWPALLLAAAASLVHPTTGLWFCLWIGVAAFVSDRRARAPLVGVVAALGAGIMAWLAWRGVPSALFTRMDGVWLSALGSKEYLFPDAWHAWAWALALAYPVLIGLVLRSRSVAGCAGPRERGLVAGALALFLVLLAALPLIAARHAATIQAQVPRVLWMLELLATAYIVWWLIERPSSRPGRGRLAPARPGDRRRARRVRRDTRRLRHVRRARRPARPASGSAADEWRDAMNWLAATPATAHVLADPGHAWKYGSSVRVAALRDVFQEEAKDSAFAIYSRDTAVRVLERIGEIGDFRQMTAGRARALAERYDLDYLVAEQPFNLPVAYRNNRFTILLAQGPLKAMPRHGTQGVAARHEGSSPAVGAARGGTPVTLAS